MRTNYDYPDEMLKRLRKAKKLTGMPIVEMIRRAINEYLAKYRL